VSTKGNVNLFGAINVTGPTATTTLKTQGFGADNIDAENAANHFGASLSLSNAGFGATKVVSAGSLALGNVSTPNSPLTVAALAPAGVGHVHRGGHGPLRHLHGSGPAQRGGQQL